MGLGDLLLSSVILACAPQVVLRASGVGSQVVGLRTAAQDVLVCFWIAACWLCHLVVHHSGLCGALLFFMPYVAIECCCVAFIDRLHV